MPNIELNTTIQLNNVMTPEEEKESLKLRPICDEQTSKE
jgi:hypothetical protein